MKEKDSKLNRIKENIKENKSVYLGGLALTSLTILGCVGAYKAGHKHGESAVYDNFIVRMGHDPENRMIGDFTYFQNCKLNDFSETMQAMIKNNMDKYPAIRFKTDDIGCITYVEANF